VVGGVGGLNQTQLRPLLGYSSIGHIGWILIGGRCSKFISVFYFFIYFLIRFCVVWLFFYSSYYSLSARSSLFNFSFFGLFLFLGLFLSLGGVPPLTGFFPKWIVISIFPSPSLLLFLLVGSLVNLYYYLNICFSIFVCRDSIYLSSVSISFPVLLLFFCFLRIFGLPLLWYALVLFY
jgi:NADH:ubiquinone oxidoreductase subunit 2 (subunit N)